MQLRTEGAPDTDLQRQRGSGGRRGWALAVAGLVFTGVLTIQNQGHAHGLSGRAVLRDAASNAIGVVRFSEEPDGKILVRAVLTSTLAPGYHGFHVHANGAGTGCVADASQPPSTWFTSVGGHYKHADDGAHGDHAGDLPSLLVHDDGTAHLTFKADRVDVQELDGKALVVHAKPDNFGNVPVGPAANQYTPNSAQATTSTQNTGNAGDRVACGVIELK